MRHREHCRVHDALVSPPTPGVLISVTGSRNTRSSSCSSASNSRRISGCSERAFLASSPVFAIRATFLPYGPGALVLGLQDAPKAPVEDQEVPLGAADKLLALLGVGFGR